MMINTPEFWVGVAFFICIFIAYRLIFPSVKAGLIFHQGEIEKLFSNAESLLEASERNFSLTQERLDALPNIISDMEKEFDLKINHLLQDWNAQQEKIRARYHLLQAHKIKHLKDHAKSQSYERITGVCINALQTYINQHMSAKKHQQIVMQALKNLPTAQ